MMHRDWHRTHPGAKEACRLADRLWRRTLTQSGNSHPSAARWFQLSLNHLMDCDHPPGKSFDPWLPKLRELAGEP